MKQFIGNFWFAILSGVAIGVGGAAFLMNASLGGSKMVGSLLFCAGLYMVVTLGWHLYTGKVGYVFGQKYPAYLNFLALVWVGNYVGSIIWGTTIRYVYSSNDAFLATAEKVADAKIALSHDAPFKLFVLAILCNFLVVMAVEQFRFNPHVGGKYIGIIAGISVFVFLGFEHSVANMFYMAVAGKTGAGFLNILIVTAGNSVGGIIVPGSKLLKEYCDAEEVEEKARA